MTVAAGDRELVRQRAGFRCEFCGVHETDAGGELTIDHYRPLAFGGSDDPANLIYACSRCNLYKHDYWPASEDAPRLWNPREEPLTDHLRELPDGTLEARSPAGELTLRQLRLNRPQLAAFRQRRRRLAGSQQQLQLYGGIVSVFTRLLEEQAALAEEQNELLQELRELLIKASRF